MAENNCRVIAIGNQKGGVGKTTSVINIGACLAELGQRVLLIDMDSQANLTLGLGVLPEDDETSSVDVLSDSEILLRDAIVETEFERLHLVPSHLSLATIEAQLSDVNRREFRLLDSFTNEKELYDFIIIDCPPNLGLLTVNGLCAASEAFIALETQQFALAGVPNFFHLIEVVQEVNPTLRLTGAIITKHDIRTRNAQAVLGVMQNMEGLKEFLMDTIVRVNVRLAEAPGEGVPVIIHDPSCSGAKAYRELAEEVLRMNISAQIS